MINLLLVLVLTLVSFPHCVFFGVIPFYFIFFFYLAAAPVPLNTIAPQGECFKKLETCSTHHSSMFIYLDFFCFCVNEVQNMIWTMDLQSEISHIWKHMIQNEVVQIDNKVKFRSDTLKWPSQTEELYVRNSYITMTEEILNKQLLCVYITGTSGIGKSMYLLYLMYVLSSQTTKPTICYKTREAETFLLLPNGNVQKCVTKSPVYSDQCVPSYVLIDSIDVQTVDFRYGPHILVGSNTKYFKEYQKRMKEVSRRSKKFYMDVWSQNELQNISSYPIDVHNLRYDVFGGSARNFKAEIQSTIDSNNGVYSTIVDEMLSLFFGSRMFTTTQDTWTAALQSIKLSIIEQLNTIEETLNNTEAFSSMFNHTDTNGNQMWASKFLKCLAGKIIEVKVLSLSDRLKLLVGESGMGIAFESIGHEAFVKSNNFEYTSTSIVKYQRPATFKFKVPSKVEIFRAIADISSLSFGWYAIPVTGNFPCIDSIVPPNILLQFTTALTHKGNEETMNSIRANLSETNRAKHVLIFVIPKENLEKFQRQEGYGDIKQYKVAFSPLHENGSMDLQEL